MNFFKSVFSDEPEPQSPPDDQHSDPDRDRDQHPPQGQSPSSSDPNAGSAWDFGGLIKTLSIKSESVIETYRRDLQEFGSGLKKEIEVAQGSLGSVGHAIDELGSTVIKGTGQIIAKSKEAILAGDLRSNESPRESAKSQDSDQNPRGYSRFEAQLRAIQSDAATYCDEPEDADDYKKWKQGFDLVGKGEEIRVLSEENDVVKGFYVNVVPSTVDHDSFWCRYFYRMYKLEQAESFRARLRKAISTEQEELSWDASDDEEDDEEVNVVKPKSVDSEETIEDDSKSKEVSHDSRQGDVVLDRNLVDKEIIDESDKEGKAKAESQESRESSDKKSMEDASKVETGENPENTRTVTSEESGNVEKEAEASNSNSKSEAVSNVAANAITKPEKPTGNDHETAVGAGKPSASEEEDLGWDEIEDLSSIDDHRVSREGDLGSDRAELRKRLSAAEEEEDLSWDIEDDDEPPKA